MKNIFDPSIANEVIQRIEKLSPSTPAKWGKMDVAQMLAHCNVTYELVYTTKHPKPNEFVKFLLKLFIKNAVVNEKPYKNNSNTAPVFIISDPKVFEEEKNRLIDYIKLTAEKGANYFDYRESHSFGALTTSEWNNMFYKHLDHHLTQFGV